MADHKKQHYVPKMYMKRFSNNKLFYIYNAKTGELIGNYSYIDQAYKNYYYGKDKKWELKLQSLETSWDISIGEIINKNFSNNVIKDIKEFAVYQIGRTPKELNRENKNTKELIKKLLKHSLKTKGLYSSSYENVIESAAFKETERNTKPEDLLNVYSKLTNSIDDLSVAHLVINNPKLCFISSDNPVCKFNYYIPGNVGLGIIGLIIVFPISPTNAVVLFDSKIYSNAYNNQIIEANSYIVKGINEMIYYNADEIVYSKQEISNCLFKTNSKLINRNPIPDNNILNNRDDLILLTHVDESKYRKKLPFLKIEHKYKIVPQNYRLKIPRVYSESRYKDLQIEFQVKPFKKILSDKPDEMDEYLNSIELNKKILFDYWGLHK